MNSPPIQIDLEEITSSIHQAALSPFLNEEDLNQICEVSTYFQFDGLCTNLVRLPQARKALKPIDSIKLIAVIAFPFGDIPTHLKIEEAEWAVSQGANALEIVPNYFALTQGKIDVFAEEIAQLCELGVETTAILNIPNCSKEMIKSAVEASIEAGVHSIQSGNGFGPPVESSQIQLLSKLTRNRCAIKAVGGIKDLNHVIELINAGATYIGTSFGKEIMEEFRRRSK